MPPLDASRDTRSELLASARDLLLEHGLEGFSMRKVASACDVSAAAIYRHFTDKDALISRVIEEGARTFTSYLLSSLKEPTPERRLRAMGRRYFDFAREHPRDYELLFVQDCVRLGMPAVDQTAREESQASFRLLVDRVVECQRAGVVRAGSPEALAVFVWSSLHGLASLSLSGHLGSGVDVEALRDAQLDLVLAGVAPPA